LLDDSSSLSRSNIIAISPVCAMLLALVASDRGISDVLPPTPVCNVYGANRRTKKTTGLVG
jgi:hypothetical protein